MSIRLIGVFRESIVQQKKIHFIEMLLCGLNSWRSVWHTPMLRELPALVGNKHLDGWGLTAWLQVWKHIPFPHLPKNPLPFTHKTALPQCWVSYPGFHHILCISSLLREDPLLRGCPVLDVRKRLRAAPAAHGRRQKYGSGNPWDYLATDPDVWWDITAIEHLNILICFKSIAKSPLKQP